MDDINERYGEDDWPTPPSEPEVRILDNLPSIPEAINDLASLIDVKGHMFTNSFREFKQIVL
jgi:hypothetical protein